MTQQGKVVQPDDEDVPLLSEDGRQFVDGEINAEDYIKIAWRAASELAERDLDRHLPYRRLRLGVQVVLAIVGIAYAILGIVSFTSTSNQGIGSVALGTSGAAIIAAALTRYIDRNGDRNQRMLTSDSVNRVIAQSHDRHTKN